MKAHITHPGGAAAGLEAEGRQRRIERLLEEAGEAITKEDWPILASRARPILAFDPDNGDALDLIAAAERALSGSGASPSAPPPPSSTAPTPHRLTSPPRSPTAAMKKKLLGEGGKKKVYLAQDTLPDREVASALIKTEGLDDVSHTAHHPGGPGHGTPPRSPRKVEIV